MFSFRDVDLPENKELLCFLQHIKGVGWWKALVISSRFGFACPFFVSNLNVYKFSLLSFLLKYMVMSEVKVNSILNQRIRELIVLRCYRGLRHDDFLPVRGQRTRTNANASKQRRFRKNF